MGNPRTADAAERLAKAAEKRARKKERTNVSITNPLRTPNSGRPRTTFGKRSAVPHFVRLKNGGVWFLAVLVEGTENLPGKGPKPTTWLRQALPNEAATIFTCQRDAERAVDRTRARFPMTFDSYSVRQVA